MQLNLLVVAYVASAALSGAVAVVAWRHRPMVGARGLALLMLAVAWWLGANALEAASVERSTKIAWSVVAYPGIELVPVLYVAFVLGWTRQDAWLTRGRIALLLIVPVISVGMAATNEWHRLLWSSVTLIDAWGVSAVYEHGPWFWVEVAYSYILIGGGLVALIVAVFRYPEVYSTRMRLAIVASLVPIVAGLAYAAGLDRSLHADLSSISFAVAGLIGAWGMLRLRLLELAPVAWATLVQSLGDAVIAIDPARRIVAFNPSATRLLGMGGDVAGEPIELALRAFPELVAICRATDDQEVEIPVGPGVPGSSGADASAIGSPDARWFNVRLTGIRDGRARDVGWLVVLREVTERKQMVETIRRLSLTDELTGLLNRRGFTTLAEQQLRTSMRTRNRLWLVFVDLDGLKDINDRLGHEAGDRALCETAALLRTAPFREADIVARLGGDEFAVLTTEISHVDGEVLVERVERAVRAANEARDRESFLSVSAGAALFDPDRPKTLDELIGEADRRMYRAKHRQRPGPTMATQEADPEPRIAAGGPDAAAGTSPERVPPLG